MNTIQRLMKSQWRPAIIVASALIAGIIISFGSVHQMQTRAWLAAEMARETPDCVKPIDMSQKEVAVVVGKTYILNAPIVLHPERICGWYVEKPSITKVVNKEPMKACRDKDGNLRLDGQVYFEGPAGVRSNAPPCEK